MEKFKNMTIVADVSNEEAVKNYVDATIEEFGSIDGGESNIYGNSSNH